MGEGPSPQKTNKNSPPNYVAVKDLPLYREQPKRPLSAYRFVEEEPLLLQAQCHKVRLAIAEKYANFAKQFQPIDKIISSVTNNVKNADEYLRSDEATVIPKAAAITVGGLAGLVLSLRRYGTIRKIVYPAAGMLVMAAFCYPNESVEFAQIGYYHALRTWKDFRKSPEPETPPKKK